MNRIKLYYSALKPERTFANVMTTAAGFLFASARVVDIWLFVATLAGTTLIVWSACAVNNCIDREIDSRMPRTKKRATVTGEVPVRNLAILAAVLGILGAVVLAKYVNMLTLFVGLIGYIDYVVLYGWSKRNTIHSTLIGTISGAAPIVAGYTAASGQFDLTALLLGLVMVFWQMPHFYAISIFRKSDYEAGKIPVWPVVRGVRDTQAWILVYTVLYVIALGLLATVGNAGIIFTVVLGSMGLYWLYIGFNGFKQLQPEKWARSMFGFSLITLLVLAGGVALAPILP